MLEAIAKSVCGAVITDIQETPDGAHVMLDDGTCLIFHGATIVALVELTAPTIQ